VTFKADVVEKIGNSSIQHGPSSSRVYLMKLDLRDMPAIIDEIDKLAHKRKYAKSFVKVPLSAAEEFKSCDYEQEAAVPGFFQGKVEGVFLSKYFKKERKNNPHKAEIERIVDLSRQRAGSCCRETAEPGTYTYSLATVDDAPEMSFLYRKVFPSYPFPIDDPDYLVKTMRSHIRYYAARKAGEIVALSSAEMDKASGNVEMTDFATLPEYRRQGLAGRLLFEMEADMRRRGIVLAYTIARALSAGMNITFAKSGYAFAGTLINNTNISGNIESMNVWWKSLIDR
jgi:beta-lysine N6-acetyltransferase